jgi:hypothetical protein
MKAQCAFLRIVTVLAAALSFAGGLNSSSRAAVVNFSWTQNSESDLAGYKLYYGPASRTYTNNVLLGKVNTYSMDVPDQTPCYFALVAYNSNYVQSALSTELRYPNAPVLGALAARTIAEDSSVSIPLSVGDVDTPLSALTLSAVSSNLTLVPANNITFSGTGSNRTMTITPASNRSGSAGISVRVSDGAFTITRSFLLTVTGIADAPTISSIADTTIDEDTEAGPFSFTISDADTPATKLKLRVASSNTRVIATNRIFLSVTNGIGTVRLRPPRNRNGSAMITLTVSDPNGLSASRSFNFTVRPVNDAPTITSIPNRALREDQRTKISFQVSDVETASSNLQVTASSSNPGVVPQQDLILGIASTNRTLTIVPAYNVSGSTVITLTVSDGEATASTAFTVTYSSVNDAPVVSRPPNLTVNRLNPVPPIPFTVWDAETAADQLGITLTSSNTTLLPTTNMVLSGAGTNRTLTLTPRPNTFGRSLITIRVSDGVTNTRVSFLFTFTSSNNAPVLTVPASLAGNPGTAVAVHGMNVADLDAGINNLNFRISAANGTLSIDTAVIGGVMPSQVSGNNSGNLTVVAPLAALNTTLASAGGVTYTSRSDFSGTETLVVTVNDNGFSGAGGAKTDTEIIPIQVAGANRLQAWRASYFIAADLQDPAKEATVWGDLADPDNDGRLNLMEFALGLNPLGSEPQEFAFVTQIVSDTGNRYLTLTFNARMNEPTLQYIPEVSPDGTTWSATAQRTANLPVNSEFAQVTYQDSVPIISDTARFIRLRVSHGGSETTSEPFVGSAVTVPGVAGTGERVGYFSLRAVRPAVYAGKATSVGTSAITDSGANWTSGLFAGRGALYAEFDNGLEADIQQLDIPSSTLSFAGALPPSVNPGAAYRIREHHTLASVFGPADQAGLLAGASEAEAEAVLHHIPETQETKTYFYVNASTGWVQPDYSSASSTVIYPEQGLMVRRRTSGDLTLAFSGPLKHWPSLIRVLPDYNFLGLYNRARPVRLNDLNLIASGFVAGDTANDADNIVKVNSDGTMTTFYLNPQGWYDSNNQAAGDVTFLPGTVFIIYRRPPAAAFDWLLPAQ